MAKWRPNQKQWLVIWPAVLVGGLSLLAGMIVVGVSVLAIGAALVWHSFARPAPGEHRRQVRDL